MMVDIEGTGTGTDAPSHPESRQRFARGRRDRSQALHRLLSAADTPRFYGSNFADRLCATQNARTVLTRSILDHAVITNSPRYMVTKGGLTNPRELIDNRVGGLVNVTRPDAIAPLPQAPLNPFVFQTLEALDQDEDLDRRQPA